MDLQSGHEPYHHGDLRNALITVAQQVLRAEGAGEVTFRRLARETGVSHNAPYRHFKNQMALFAVLSERGYARLRDLFADAVRTAPDDIPVQLIAFGQSYVAFALDNPNLYRLMVSRDVIPSEEDANQPELLDVFQRAAAALTGLFTEGQRRGQIKTGAPERQAVTYWSLLHGLALLWIDQQIEPFFTQPGATPADLTTPALNFLLNGLALTLG